MASFLDLPRPTKTYHSTTYNRISPAKFKAENKGKTVLVTGGATGISLSISKSFAEAGVKRVIIISRSAGPQAEAKQKLGATFPDVEILTFQATVTDQPAVAEIMRMHGPIDVLVLCAAVTHEHLPLVDIPFKDIESTFNTNVIGNLGIVQSYLQQSASPSGQKTIINVSSAAGHIPIPNVVGYGPSKAAFTQMITALTLEHTPESGVRMFSYHPGAFLTKAAQSAGLKGNEFVWEDITLPGNFAVWLAGPESTFLNGKMLWAHWDVDELIAMREKIAENPDCLTFGLVQRF